jgi:hypothetical protein
MRLWSFVYLFLYVQNVRMPRDVTSLTGFRKNISCGCNFGDSYLAGFSVVYNYRPVKAFLADNGATGNSSPSCSGIGLSPIGHSMSIERSLCTAEVALNSL